MISAARSFGAVFLPLFGVWSDIRVYIATTQMRRGLHMGVVNVRHPLSEAGRHHLLVIYILMGFVASLTYAVS